jgi:hypothetical protein
VAVEIFTAKMGIASSCKDFRYTVVDGEEGDMKRATAKIIYDDLRSATSLVETIGDGCCVAAVVG